MKRALPRLLAVMLCAVARVAAAQAGIAPSAPTLPAPQQPAAGIVRSEFVFTQAPFASAHASTMTETKRGLLVAWFGGTHEGANDVGIWASRWLDGAWTAPVKIATGMQDDGSRLPTWNPVLFTLRDGTLLLFYKVGIGPQRWWGMLRRSSDDGLTWSAPERLSHGVLGPIKNRPLQLADGTLLSPSSTESFEANSKWRVHFERSTDNGRSWTTSRPLNDTVNAIQPSLLRYTDGRLLAIGRSRTGFIVQTTSTDDGLHWSALSNTSLPNPNSGTDAITLRDGRFLVVYNHTRDGRTPLNVAVSRDGVRWEAALVLERAPGEYSYPTVIQSADGLVHVTYTWNRQRVKHVVIDPRRLSTTAIEQGDWPANIR